MEGITKKGLFAISNNDYAIRAFDNKEEYLKWKERTDKKGHSMGSFYMIRQMLNQYSIVNENDFNKYLLEN